MGWMNVIMNLCMDGQDGDVDDIKEGESSV